MFSYGKFEFNNLTKFDLVWHVIDLLSGHTLKYLPPSNSASQMTYKAYRTTLCNIFILMTSFGLAWQKPLLSKRHIIICYLFHSLGSLLAKFGFAAVISSVSVTDDAKRDDFDLWPDLDLNFNLLKKILLKSTRWELSIAFSPTPLRLLVRGLAG